MKAPSEKDILALNEARPSKLPSILISNKQLREVTADALKGLKAANEPPSVFVRAGQLVRIVADENGQARIKALSGAALRGRLTRVADFYKKTQGGKTPVSPPMALVNDIESLGDWDFPRLADIIETPVLRPDGSTFDIPGYDLVTGRYYAPAEALVVPPVSANPTAEEVRSAVAVIDDVLGEFPYENPASKANAIAAILTPILRPAIKGPVPLALLDAPQQGTGKSLLSSVIALVATGRPNRMLPAPDNDEEWRKRITAVLHSGASVITLDNLEGQLKAPSLAAVLTSEVWQDRLLGRSEAIELPQNATWLATGNNIRLGGDLQRRCYHIRLDAQSATPWLKAGYKHPDLKGWVLENRGPIIAALLTLARAWFAAGKPRPEGKPLGSFESWWETVGGTLRNAGVGGFLGNLEKLYSQADEEAAEWEGFYVEIENEFAGKAFTTADLVAKLESSASLKESLPEELGEALKTGGATGNLGKRLGKAFARRQGRRFGATEIRVEPAGEVQRAKKWRVLSNNTALKAPVIPIRGHQEAFVGFKAG
jgi:hypothetical protein